MPTAVLDTSVLFAARSEHDRWHDEASAIVTSVRTGDLRPCVVPTNVLQETLKHVQNHSKQYQARRTLDALVATDNITLVHPNGEHARRGRELFRLHDGVEFTSAAVAAYMQCEGIDLVYAFGRDSDYDNFDRLTRLDVPEDL